MATIHSGVLLGNVTITSSAFSGISFGDSLDVDAPVSEIVYNQAPDKHLMMTFGSGNIIFESGTVSNETITLANSTTVTQTVSTSYRNDERSFKGIYDPDTEQTIIAAYNGSNIDVMVANVSSDGNITVGSAVTVSDTFGYQIVDMIYDTNRNEVILFTYESGNAIQAHVGTVSTNSISFGSTITAYSLPDGFYDGAVAWDSANNQFLLYYKGYSNSYFYTKAVRGTSSGTSISLGTWYSTNYLPGGSGVTHYGYRGSRLKCVGSNKFALVTVINNPYAGEGITGVIITTSGTNAPTVNTHSAINNYPGRPINDTIPEVAFDGTRLVVAYAGGTADTIQEHALIAIGSIGSTSITWSDITPLVSTGSEHSEETYDYYGAIAYDSTANRIVVTSERTTSGYHSAAIRTLIVARVS